MLVVDDDPGVLESQADLLRKECRVYATSDVNKAMALLADHDVALVLTDQRMPGMTGTELLAHAADLSPSTVRMLITAYSDIEAVIQAINTGHVFYYFTKPWNPEQLVKAVRAAIETHRLSVEKERLLAELALFAQGGTVPVAHVPADDIERLRLGNQLLVRSLAQVKETFLHLQRIQEVVPVCLKCGKIKTGDSRWEAVLEYLAAHSNFLSHGYCPECRDQVRKEWQLPPVDGVPKSDPSEGA